jgi:hypothetical protein
MSSTLYYKLQLKGETPENNETEAFEGMRIKLIKFDIVDKDTQLGKLPSNTFTLRVFNKTGDELNELNDDVKWNPSMGGGTTENPLIVEVEDLETETTTSGTFSWVVETEQQGEALSFEWLRHCANASFLIVLCSAGRVVRFCCIGLRFFQTHFQCAACSSGVTTLTLSSYYVTFVRCVVVHAMQFRICFLHYILRSNGLTRLLFICRVVLASPPSTTNAKILQAITKLQAAVAEVTKTQIEIKADLNYVKNLTPFKPNTVLSISQVGQEAINDLAVPNEVFPPVDGAPSVLNREEQDVLHKLTKEEDVVEYLTPHFERIFAVANANLVVVNPEIDKWFDTDRDPQNYQKVDLFVCHKALYTAFPTAVDRTRRFGELSNWILHECIGVVMKAKVDFTTSGLNEAVGQIVNHGAYVAYLARNSIEQKVVKLVLFDKHKFYFTHMNNGILTRLIESRWTDAGSETFLRESLYRPSSWMKLLDAACQRHSLAVEPGSFLGYGADGRVFKVSNSSEEQYAVKLVLAKSVDNLTYESNMLQSAYTVCPKHVIRVVHPSEDFEDIGGFMVTELGTMVERDEYKRIIEALVALHCSDIVHGDARLNNVVEVGESIKWIDFREFQFPTDNLSDQQPSDMFTRMKQLEMMTLMKSLLQISEDGDLPPGARTLVAWNYNENVTDNQIQIIIEEFKKIYDSLNEMRVLG